MKNYFKKAWFLNILVSLILIGAYLYDRDIWQHLFVFLLAFSLSSILRPYMGGTQKMIVTNDGIGEYKYLFYLISIVLTMAVLGFATKYLQKWISSLQGFWGVVLPTLILVALVYVNYWVTIYRVTKE